MIRVILFKEAKGLLNHRNKRKISTLIRPYTHISYENKNLLALLQFNLDNT
ncbi:hypothetical protein CpB1110 [Chlamydia pneumoniae TW-183]|uniref:Uncharacterized protein n=1 Tax=Chlamydia pneumoniae TaxID=83558 RepID=A0ABN3YQN7_CHLPN|nr:hypothetical protein CpB1110 [Chlamydia pneumoniae TW-183]